MELLMENKEKVMDDYLFNLKFMMSKTRLKIFYHVVLICTIHCIVEIIYSHCGVSGYLSDEIFFSSRLQKAIFYRFVIKKNMY